MLKCNDCKEVFEDWEENRCPKCGSFREDIYAKDINSCDSCPLYCNECGGGWSSGWGGEPVEPPCTSWNDDMLVYSGMYD